MFTTRPELHGSVGMVSSTHWLASATGMAMLEAGGNAFDAAVAAGFTLQVVEPHLNGPGGDVPLIFAGPKHPPTVLCGQGTAPAGATIEHYRGLGMDLIPGSGLLAAVVPGSTAAWLTLLRDHGTATLRQVFDAPIHYALTGIPVLPQIAATIDRVSDLFRNEWPSSAQLYLGHGEWLRNPMWASTLQRLLDEAEAASSDRAAQIEHALNSWQRGFVASEIDAFVQLPSWDSSGGRHAGVLTADDIAAWQPSYEQPATLDFRGATICKTGPWGQGPVLLQQLALLDGFDLRPGTADFVHTVTECAKLAFADREAWYGDSPDVPLDALLSKAYADSRRALVGDDADGELRPGRPERRTPRLPDALAGAAARADSDEEYDPTTSEPTVSRTGASKGDTCHVSVADRFGNLVAATPSGGWLHSSPVIPSLGFPLGTRLADDVVAGRPAELTRARAPATHHAVALAHAARRCAGDGLRDAGRRPAGSVAARLPAQPPARGDEPAGIDRRASLSQHALPELVLSARVVPEAARGRGPARHRCDRRAAQARARRRRERTMVARPDVRGVSR